MLSKSAASWPVPAPFAIARSMLSFGMEYERAFSTALASARLLSGSPPPSFAATMIARESFEKSFPRLASAAPFLCLIEDHLLCPDMTLLLDQFQEALVHPRVVGQLGVECGDKDTPCADEDRRSGMLGEHLDVVSELRDSRRADEDAVQRPLVSHERERRLEARDLPAVRVAVDGHVDQAEVPAAEQDHPGAGSEDRPLEAAQRFVDPVQAREPHDRGGLAAGDDEAVEAVKLLGLSDFDQVGAEAP